MPLYDYQCAACEHVFERTLKISEARIPEAEACPSCNQTATVQKIIGGAPLLGDPVRMGVTKIPGDFKEVLQKIHERNYKSNLNLKYS
jgi:putative FmdB family regulatory protein